MKSLTYSACFTLFLIGAQAAEATREGVLRSERPVSEEYLVTLEPGVARRPADPIQKGPSVPEVAQKMAFGAHGTILFTYEHALQGFAIRMPEGRAEALARDPRVKRVEENGWVEGDASQKYPPWGLNRIDQRYLPMDDYYFYGTTASNVHVFVLDSGLRTTHTQFTGRVGAGYGAINDGYGINDCYGHGTHVTGTLAGTTYGVAKGVTIHPVRVLNCQNTGTTAQIVAGVDWVTANSHLKPAVANMSLGGSPSSTMDDAVRRSINAGITYVVSAGNNNTSACNQSPARVSQAITVAATTMSDARASFSNYGSCVDLFAPGENVLSATHLSNNGFGTLSGTSMASPHVAGTAALYLAAHPTASPATVQSALICKSTKNVVSSAGSGSPNRLVYSRWDLDDPPTASFTSNCFQSTCYFSASASCDDHGISSYQWTFGDGTTGSGVSPNHTYPYAGTFSVRLTVTDTAGQTSSKTQSVTVTEQCPVCPACIICPE